MKKRYVTFLIVFIGLNLAAQDKDQELFLSGSIKNLNEFSFIDKLNQLEYTTLFHNRLNFKYIPSKELQIRLEIRNRIFYGENLESIVGFSDLISGDDGIVGLSWNLINNQKLLFNTAIDRLLINYTKKKWDITLGRQRVNWGMNLVWNPNDIFNTYNFLDFDYEERPGSDAIRIQYYLSDFNKIEVVAKKGRSEDDYIAAAMYKFNKWSYDIQLITGVFKKDYLVGFGWAGNLKNAGFKGEVSYFIPFENYFNSENVLSTSISVDYGFKKGLFINGSILYNSTNDTSKNSLGMLIYNNLTAKNLMPFNYSGFLQLSKEFSPIIAGTTSLIYSPTRQSFIFMPSLKYAMATNWELDFTSQSFFEFEDYKTLGTNMFIRVQYSF